MKKTMILAGGCFWCVEHDLREAPGVLSVTSGYSGASSSTRVPTYEDHTGYREVVLVEYDEKQTTYKKLLQYFIDHIDPTDDGGQFGDRGESYKSAIFYENESEKADAYAVLEELDASGVYEEKSHVEIVERKPFYKAEDYHQEYAQKNPVRYSLYRAGSGRENFVERTCKIREEKHIFWKE